MISFRRLCLLGCWALFPMSVLHAGSVFTFQVTVDFTPPSEKMAKAAAKPRHWEDTFVVRVEADGFAYTEKDAAGYFDVRHGVITSCSVKHGLFQDSPVVAHLGYLSAEFQNRIQLGAMLAAGGIADNPMDPVLMEHLFLQRRPESKALQPVTKKQRQRWMHGKQLLFARTENGRKLEAADMFGLVRYLQYHFGLHPDIAEALQRSGQVPDEMELVQYNHTVTRYAFKLQKVEVAAVPISRQELIRGLNPESDELDKLCEKVLATDRAAVESAWGELRQEIEKSRMENPFASVLLLLELSMSRDQILEKEIGELREELTGNVYSQSLFASLQPTSRENAEKCAKNLLSLEKDAGPGKRSVKIFRANTLTGLGRLPEAEKLLTEVLKEFPYNAGAWKDLGDVYYNMYQMHEAWKCWGVARALVPTHKNLKPVYELEERLKKKFPQFQ